MLLRGCRLKTITDQDPYKSDLETFKKKVLRQMIFISIFSEEYQIIFTTFYDLKNQRQPVLSMEMKHQGCAI